MARGGTAWLLLREELGAGVVGSWVPVLAPGPAARGPVHEKEARPSSVRWQHRPLPHGQMGLGALRSVPWP